MKRNLSETLDIVLTIIVQPDVVGAALERTDRSLNVVIPRALITTLHHQTSALGACDHTRQRLAKGVAADYDKFAL